MNARNPGDRRLSVARGETDPGLVVVKKTPFNAETPLSDQVGLITPNPQFYVRTHFPIPRVDAAAWHLDVEGEVHRPIQLTFDDLRSLPSRSLMVTLECAGNGRSAMSPPAEGEQWGYGAVSNAEWTGTPLSAVLEAVGLTDRAREVVFAGADRGTAEGRVGAIPFARSLALDVALAPYTLVAYAMNGSLLPAEHGFPIRLLVPGWYGMASVKWVERIEVIAGHFDGFFQEDRYVMAHAERSETTRTPLTTVRPRSIIVNPAPGATLSLIAHRIRVLAWAVAAPVVRVEVSVDGGASWEPTSFASGSEDYAWRRWEYLWRPRGAGRATLRSRAFDAVGDTQPSEPEWNRLGYANNAVQVVPVEVR